MWEPPQAPVGRRMPPLLTGSAHASYSPAVAHEFQTGGLGPRRARLSPGRAEPSFTLGPPVGSREVHLCGDRRGAFVAKEQEPEPVGWCSWQRTGKAKPWRADGWQTGHEGEGRRQTSPGVGEPGPGGATEVGAGQGWADRRGLAPGLASGAHVSGAPAGQQSGRVLVSHLFLPLGTDLASFPRVIREGTAGTGRSWWDCRARSEPSRGLGQVPEPPAWVSSRGPRPQSPGSRNLSLSRALSVKWEFRTPLRPGLSNGQAHRGTMPGLSPLEPPGPRARVSLARRWHQHGRARAPTVQVL